MASTLDVADNVIVAWQWLSEEISISRVYLFGAVALLAVAWLSSAGRQHIVSVFAGSLITWWVSRAYYGRAAEDLEATARDLDGEIKRVLRRADLMMVATFDEKTKGEFRQGLVSAPGYFRVGYMGQGGTLMSVTAYAAPVPDDEYSRYGSRDDVGEGRYPCDTERPQ